MDEYGFVTFACFSVVSVHRMLSSLCFQAASQIVATILKLSRVKSPTLSPRTNPVSYNEVFFVIMNLLIFFTYFSYKTKKKIFNTVT